MNSNKIIDGLKKNISTYESLLLNTPHEEHAFKSGPKKWSLLEIVCHMHDEEREDFRARLKHVLENNPGDLPPIDPPAWVVDRKYSEQNYQEALRNFIKERKESIQWLNSLASPQWDNAYVHPKFGEMSGKLFLSNWLAHDYLHIRQILSVKHEYLKSISGESLSYAGDW
jgi:DinB superfamily